MNLFFLPSGTISYVHNTRSLCTVTLIWTEKSNKLCEVYAIPVESQFFSQIFIRQIIKYPKT